MLTSRKKLLSKLGVSALASGVALLINKPPARAVTGLLFVPLRNGFIETGISNTGSVLTTPFTVNGLPSNAESVSISVDLATVENGWVFIYDGFGHQGARFAQYVAGASALGSVVIPCKPGNSNQLQYSTAGLSSPFTLTITLLGYFIP